MISLQEDLGWCELAAPPAGAAVGLAHRERVERGGGAIPTFGVVDLDAARSSLEADGVRFDGHTIVVEGQVKLATFYDPDGNALMLYEGLDPSRSIARWRRRADVRSPSYRVSETSRFEGRRKTIAPALEARAVKLNHFDSESGQPGQEHHEVESGQEEVYIPLRGSGVLRVDGDEVPLEPGRYVLVEPEATRQVVAGSDGLSYAVVGAEVATTR